jgi:hypothetical protein
MPALFRELMSTEPCESDHAFLFEGGQQSFQISVAANVTVTSFMIDMNRRVENDSSLKIDETTLDTSETSSGSTVLSAQL